MSEPMPINPPADPLGRRRCPKCLYDRFGLAEGQPCPECGYLLPAGVTVLTFHRPELKSRGLWIVAAAMLIWTCLILTRTSQERISMFVGMSPVVIVACSYLARTAWSEQAYTRQVWLSRDGVGLESDADRFSPLRPLTNMPGRVIAVLPMFAGGIAGSHGWESSFIHLAVIAAIVTMAMGLIGWSLRRAALPRLDPVAPRMYRWDELTRLEIGRSHGRRFALKLRFRRFFSWPLGVVLEGDETFALRLGQAVADAR